jgi:hypothetical protein
VKADKEVRDDLEAGVERVQEVFGIGVWRERSV